MQSESLEALSARLLLEYIPAIRKDKSVIHTKVSRCILTKIKSVSMKYHLPTTCEYVSYIFRRTDWPHSAPLQATVDNPGNFATSANTLQCWLN